MIGTRIGSELTGPATAYHDQHVLPCPYGSSSFYTVAPTVVAFLAKIVKALSFCTGFVPFGPVEELEIFFFLDKGDCNFNESISRKWRHPHMNRGWAFNEGSYF